MAPDLHRCTRQCSLLIFHAQVVRQLLICQWLVQSQDLLLVSLGNSTRHRLSWVPWNRSLDGDRRKIPTWGRKTLQIVQVRPFPIQEIIINHHILSLYHHYIINHISFALNDSGFTASRLEKSRPGGLGLAAGRDLRKGHLPNCLKLPEVRHFENWNPRKSLWWSIFIKVFSQFKKPWIGVKFPISRFLPSWSDELGSVKDITSTCSSPRWCSTLYGSRLSPWLCKEDSQLSQGATGICTSQQLQVWCDLSIVIAAASTTAAAAGAAAAARASATATTTATTTADRLLDNSME